VRCIMQSKHQSWAIEIIEYIECSCVDCTCSIMDRENIAPSATFSIYSGRS
jgi:hypothetical protein